MADSNSEQARPHSAASDGRTTAQELVRLHVWQIQAVRDVLLIAAIFGLVWAGYAMRSVTVPLLIALLLAYLFEPAVAALTRNPKTSRPVVVGGLILTVGLLLVLVLTITVPAVVGQSMRFAQDLRQGRFENILLRAKAYIPQDYQEDYEKALGWLGAHPADNGTATPAATTQPVDSTQPASTHPQLQTDVDALPPAVDEASIRQIVREELAMAAPADSSSNPASLLQWAKGGSRTVFDLMARVFEIGLLVFLIPFYFYFFSVFYPTVVRFGRDLIPVANRPKILEMIGKMDRAVAGFVRGRIVIALIMGGLLAIGWMPCGVPYAILIGFLTGCFSIVPYMSAVGLPLAIGGLIVQELGLPPDQRMSLLAILLWPTVVFVIVQAIESYVLTPLIAGKATNLDPVTILVAVLAGGSVGGVYGMILSIPLAACGKILLTDVVLPRVRAWTQGRAQDPLPLGGD